MNSPTEPQKPKRKWLKVLGWTAVIFIGGSILLSSLDKARQDAAANQPAPNVPQDAAPAQTQPAQDNTTQTSSAAPQDTGDTGLVRKTVSGVVRTSVINFNKVMGINQQTIIFGGDADAINDGSGWYCIVNGEQNFANTVAGDTITVTGEKAGGTQALINCRVDSIQ